MRHEADDRKGRKTARTLGIISIVLGLICSCSNISAGIGILSMRLFGTIMATAVEAEEQRRAKAEEEYQNTLNRATTAEERERIEAKLEELRNQPPLPDFSKMFEAFDDPVMKLSIYGGAALGLAGKVLLIIGGIGLLKTASWGWTFSRAAAIIIIGVAVTSAIFNWEVVTPRMMEAMQSMAEEMQKMGGESAEPMPPLEAMSGSFKAMGLVQVAVTILLECAYPVILLIMLNSESVKEVFQQPPSVGRFGSRA